MPPLPWRRAWESALYGSEGFYRGAGPAAHFATATHGVAGSVLAGALLELARREGCSQVVDVGCGRGELLLAMRDVDPAIALTGVDVVDRPADLPDDIAWIVSPGGPCLPEVEPWSDALVIAHEWLDVVPCVIAEVLQDNASDEQVLREVLVDHEGVESHGGRLDADDLAWVGRWWPADALAPGDRIEVGRSRDRAWAALLALTGSGVAVCVDYGHRSGGRPAAGTLSAYRGGGQVRPVPDGSCDLTAHVAVDSLEHDRLLTQREALRELGVSAATPPHDLARTDPPAYLAALARASAAGSLMAPGGFGDFWWVARRVG